MKFIVAILESIWFWHFPRFVSNFTDVITDLFCVLWFVKISIWFFHMTAYEETHLLQYFNCINFIILPNSACLLSTCSIVSHWHVLHKVCGLKNEIHISVDRNRPYTSESLLFFQGVFNRDLVRSNWLVLSFHHSSKLFVFQHPPHWQSWVEFVCAHMYPPSLLFSWDVDSGNGFF